MIFPLSDFRCDPMVLAMHANVEPMLLKPSGAGQFRIPAHVRSSLCDPIGTQKPAIWLSQPRNGQYIEKCFMNQ
jgi:hypothetical protein